MREDQYPLAASPEEIKRLRVQAESLADEADVMLDRIGVAPGASCLDLGCGAGGILDRLSTRAGPTGRVVGMDVEDYSLAAARAWVDGLGLGNVEIKTGSIFDHDLAAESFDLVHLRYVITTIGRHEEVIQAALNLVKPGGVLAIQEADADGMNVYPACAAYDRLKSALVGTFNKIGADSYAGRRLYKLFLDAGLADVDFRACTARARSHDDLADYMPQTVLSVRETVFKLGLMTEAELTETIEACRAHLARPETISTTSTVFQVWGRKSG